MSQDKKKAAPEEEKMDSGFRRNDEEKTGKDGEKADVSEKQAPEPKAEVKAGPETVLAADQEKASGQKSPGLKAVSDWVREKRLAGWQAGALLRSTGWTDDKQVGEADFTKALAQAMNKRQGAGR